MSYPGSGFAANKQEDTMTQPVKTKTEELTELLIEVVETVLISHTQISNYNSHFTLDYEAKAKMKKALAKLRNLL